MYIEHCFCIGKPIFHSIKIEVSFGLEFQHTNWNLLLQFTNMINNILHIYIPEKLPTLKNISSYVYKQIVLNVSEVVSKYKGLFCNDFVIIIVKIYDKERIWDTDNRTIKPIQDGLVNAGVIKDDNFKSSCYMVQGFYSDKPYINVFVLKAKDILQFIDKKLSADDG